MRRVLTLFMTAVFSLSLVGGAAAQTDEPVTTSVVAPDSPLFFIQHLLDGWEEFITFDETQKAAVLAKIADNRLAEAAQMLAAGNEERAAELIEQMQDALAKAAEKIAKLQEQLEEDAAELKGENDKDENGSGDDDDEETTDQRRTEDNVVDHVLSRLQRNLERQQENRERVLENVENERAREALEKAFENSKRGLENAMERVQRRGTDAGEEGSDEDESSGEDSGSGEDPNNDEDEDSNDDEDRGERRGNGNGPPATPRGQGRP